MPRLPNLSQWVRALAETSAAMLLCLIAGGLLFSPGRAEQENSRIPQIRGEAVWVPLRDSFVAMVDRPGSLHPSQQLSRQLVVWKKPLQDPATQPKLFRTENPSSIAADPDGSRLFVGDVYGNIDGIFLDSGRGFHVGRSPKGAAVRMTCSHDGKSLVVQDPNGLVAWNVDSESSASATPLWYFLDPFVECFSLYPNDEQGIALRTLNATSNGKGKSELFEFDFRTGKPGKEIGEFAHRLVKLVISPDSRWMAALTANCEIQLFRRSAAGLPWQIERTGGITSSPSMVVCFSSDSQLLVTSSSQCNGLVVWELAEPRFPLRTESLKSNIVSCEFQDNTNFLSWSADATLCRWDAHCISPQLEIELSLK